MYQWKSKKKPLFVIPRKKFENNDILHWISCFNITSLSSNNKDRLAEGLE